MILIVASRVDDVAQRLSEELPRDSTQLLTSLDLSRPGWRVSGESGSDSICVASGGKLGSRAITGVVCLLPCIFEQELVHIEPEDRGYVAAEMTSFLIFWLSTLECRKLNPPTAGCMSGPHWPTERWLAEAAAAGLPVKRFRRNTRSNGGSDRPPEGCVTVTVAGRRLLGDDDPELGRRARALASAVGVDLLAVHFAAHDPGRPFAAADPFPDVSQAGVVEAVSDFFDLTSPS